MSSAAPSANATASAASAKESRALQIYSTVRDKIIRAEYPQGSRLTEQMLSDDLQISRVPIREAFPRLEKDGFIQLFPNRGALVSTWDAKAIHDLFDLRTVVESGATRYAARSIAHGADPAPLDEALQACEDAIARANIWDIAATSTRLHEVIVEVSGNELMVSLMKMFSGRVMWLFYMTSQLDLEDAHADHIELVRAIKSGDEHFAEATAYAHIERDRIPSFEALNATPTQFDRG